jgi:hypothetical protein
MGMPKDPTKNVDRYKIRGGVINEYEYHQNQEALAQNESKGDGKLIPGTPPEEKGERLQPRVASAATKSKLQKGTKSTKAKKAAKAAKSTKAARKAAKKSSKNAPRGASAKKLAARKAAKK